MRRGGLGDFPPISVQIAFESPFSSGLCGDCGTATFDFGKRLSTDCSDAVSVSLAYISASGGGSAMANSSFKKSH